MTSKKNNEVVEVDGAKGETPDNVVVHVSKEEAAKIEKLKKILTNKKGTTTRYINRLQEQSDKFKAASENSNKDNTRTRTALKITADQIIDTRDKLMKYSSEAEALAEEISNVLVEISASEAEEKLLTDANKITDLIEEKLSEYIDTISDAIDVSKEVTPQRNSAAPANITQQGDLFRDVSGLKPSHLEKDANLMEVLLWSEQARNYIEAGFKPRPPPTEGTWIYLAPYVHSSWANTLTPLHPKLMTLDQILSNLEAEGKKGDPKHNRRLRFMNEIRRGSDSHSDYMNKLLEASRIIEFDGMTIDELIIHIFIRDADATMGKAAQDALMEAKPNVYNVVNLIKQYESQ